MKGKNKMAKEISNTIDYAIQAKPKYAIDIGMWGKNWLQHTNKINDAQRRTG